MQLRPCWLQVERHLERLGSPTIAAQETRLMGADTAADGSGSVEMARDLLSASLSVHTA